MSRRQVVEVKCDRCNRVETQGSDKDSIKRGPDGEELSVTFHGNTTQYEDLCLRCRSAVENYFRSMTKQTEEDESDGPEKLPKPGFLGSRKG